MTRTKFNKVRVLIILSSIIPLACIIDCNNRYINLIVIVLTLIILPLIYAYLEDNVDDNK